MTSSCWMCVGVKTEFSSLVLEGEVLDFIAIKAAFTASNVPLTCFLLGPQSVTVTAAPGCSKVIDLIEFIVSLIAAVAEPD